MHCCTGHTGIASVLACQSIPVPRVTPIFCHFPEFNITRKYITRYKNVHFSIDLFQAKRQYHTEPNTQTWHNSRCHDRTMVQNNETRKCTRLAAAKQKTEDKTGRWLMPIIFFLFYYSVFCLLAAEWVVFFVFLLFLPPWCGHVTCNWFLKFWNFGISFLGFSFLFLKKIILSFSRVPPEMAKSIHSFIRLAPELDAAADARVARAAAARTVTPLLLHAQS